MRLFRLLRSRWTTDFLKCAVLPVAALVGWYLPTLCPPRMAAQCGNLSCPDRDWGFRYLAHQLYGRDPEQLGESQLESVQRWRSCLLIITKSYSGGLDSLTFDECQFVALTLEDLGPELEGRANYLDIYEGCRQRCAEMQEGIVD